jgi:predicted nucleic acid-binding protein
VLDASPLILLGGVHHLRLLEDLADTVLIPEGVAEEVRAKPEGKRALEEFLARLKVRLIAVASVPPEVEVWDLGRGESEVLAHATVLQGSRAVVDDRKARRCALAFEVPVLGTLGVVLRAKRLGLVPAARPIVTSLRQTGL